MTATYIGTTNNHYTNGSTYSLKTQNMVGRRYKDLNDREGEPDNRIMAWRDSGDPALKVYEDQAAIARDFKVLNNW